MDTKEYEGEVTSVSTDITFCQHSVGGIEQLISSDSIHQYDEAEVGQTYYTSAYNIQSAAADLADIFMQRAFANVVTPINARGVIGITVQLACMEDHINREAAQNFLYRVEMTFGAYRRTRARCIR